MPSGGGKTKERRLTFSLYLSTLAVVFFDQVSKAWALAYLAPAGASGRPLLPGILHLTFVRNTGMAFGLLQHRAFILTAVVFVCVLLLLVLSLKLRTSGRFYQLAFGLVMGGALSNLIDRLRLGYVVDFIDFRIWPVFNLADTCITIGITILLWFSFSEP